jgi:aspartate racemase
MVALSAAHAASLVARGGQVGVLASPAVRKVGLYDAALAKHGLTGLYPNDEAAMLVAIRQIKAEGARQASRQILLAASKDLAERGASVQLVACTEFSLIADSVAPQVRAFDTLDVLVDAIKAFALDTAR